MSFFLCMQAFLTEEDIFCMVLRGVEKAALCEYAVYVIPFAFRTWVNSCVTFH